MLHSVFPLPFLASVMSLLPFWILLFLACRCFLFSVIFFIGFFFSFQGLIVFTKYQNVLGWFWMFDFCLFVACMWWLRLLIFCLIYTFFVNLALFFAAGFCLSIRCECVVFYLYFVFLCLFVKNKVTVLVTATIVRT